MPTSEITIEIHDFMMDGKRIKMRCSFPQGECCDSSQLTKTKIVCHDPRTSCSSFNGIYRTFVFVDDPIAWLKSINDMKIVQLKRKVWEICWGFQGILEKDETIAGALLLKRLETQLQKSIHDCSQKRLFLLQYSTSSIFCNWLRRFGSLWSTTSSRNDKRCWRAWYFI